MTNILSVRNLTKRFGGLTAVNRCSFEILENSITALIGPNGAGKTTLFDLVTGLLPADSGEILLSGKFIGHLPAFARARLGLARTFQAIRVFPELTAISNILLAFPEFPDSLHSIFTHRYKTKLHTKALELLKRVHLHDKAHTKAGSLSYGQQKLLEILRAIATGGRIILFDEPAAGVNRTMLHTIIELIKELKREGKTVLLVEHDMGFVMNLCERIIVMDYGKEIAEGSPQEIQNNPLVLEAYLGVRKA